MRLGQDHEDVELDVNLDLNTTLDLNCRATAWGWFRADQVLGERDRVGVEASRRSRGGQSIAI
jgi:hypothetical protein